MPCGQSLTGEKGGVNTPSRVVYLMVRSDKRAGVLPGCPSPTDSEVNKKQSSSMRELWKPFIWPFIVVVVVVSVCYYEMLCISSRSLAVPRCFLFFFAPQDHSAVFLSIDPQPWASWRRAPLFILSSQRSDVTRRWPVPLSSRRRWGKPLSSRRRWGSEHVLSKY